jgi:hypothetical protein
MSSRVLGGEETRNLSLPHSEQTNETWLIFGLSLIKLTLRQFYIPKVNRAGRRDTMPATREEGMTENNITAYYDDELRVC